MQGRRVQSALDRSLGRAFRLTHRRHLGRRGHPRRLVEQPRERRAVLRVQRRTQRTAPCTPAPLHLCAPAPLCTSARRLCTLTAAPSPRHCHVGLPLVLVSARARYASWTLTHAHRINHLTLLQNGLGLEEAAPAVRDLQARCSPPLPPLQARPPGARDEG